MNKTALELPTDIRFISLDDVLYFEAYDGYTYVYLVNGKKELICKTLKIFINQLLGKPMFYKPHQSYLLNLNFMDERVKKNGLRVVMQNKKPYPLPEIKKDFLALINQYF